MPDITSTKTVSIAWNKQPDSPSNLKRALISDSGEKGSSLGIFNNRVESIKSIS